MKQGDCFFNKPGKGIPSHPWIIISDPELEPDDVVIFNLTDAANWDDKTCIVEPTEHPGWLTKQSCVAFQYAIVTSLKNLKQGETAGVYFKRSHVPKELLEKIINALQNADELKNAVKVVLTRQGLMS